MRNTALVLVTLLTHTANAQTWVPVTGIPLSSLCATISADTCQVARSASSFLVTHDGGLTYDSTNTIFTTEWLSDIHFPTDQVGYACGGSHFGVYREIIVRTTDGGTTWSPVTYDQYNCYTFDHIRFATDDIGLVAGPYTFLRTIDGGSTFQPIDLQIPGSANVTDLYFDGDIGYASTVNAQIWPGINYDIFQLLQTNDLGETWTVLYTDTLIDYTYIQDRRIYAIRTAGDFGLACGANGRVWRTTDGWSTWTEQQILSDTTFFHDIELVNEQTAFLTSALAYAGGYRNTMQTNDGGLTWFVIPHKFHSISVRNGAGYAIDETGQLWKNPNVLLSVEEPQIVGLELFPNPAMNSVTVQLPQVLTKGRYTIFDANGRSVAEQNFTAQTRIMIDLHGLAPGAYTLEISDAITSKNYRERLVVQ